MEKQPNGSWRKHYKISRMTVLQTIKKTRNAGDSWKRPAVHRFKAPLPSETRTTTQMDDSSTYWTVAKS